MTVGAEREPPERRFDKKGAAATGSLSFFFDSSQHLRGGVKWQGRGARTLLIAEGGEVEPLGEALMARKGRGGAGRRARGSWAQAEGGSSGWDMRGHRGGGELWQALTRLARQWQARAGAGKLGAALDAHGKAGTGRDRESGESEAVVRARRRGADAGGRCRAWRGRRSRD